MAEAVQLAREYETIYVLRPDVAKEASEKIANRLDEVVGREGGKLTLIENWGRRGLAYPVSKYRRGVYVYLKYVGGTLLVQELERNLRMFDDVLKYMTVQLRIDLDFAGVEVDPEKVKFEATETPADEEDDDTLERRLGLEEPKPDEQRGSDERRGSDSDEDSEDYEGPNLNGGED